MEPQGIDRTLVHTSGTPIASVCLCLPAGSAKKWVKQCLPLVGHLVIELLHWFSLLVLYFCSTPNTDTSHCKVSVSTLVTLSGNEAAY